MEPNQYSTQQVAGLSPKEKQFFLGIIYSLRFTKRKKVKTDLDFFQINIVFFNLKKLLLSNMLSNSQNAFDSMHEAPNQLVYKGN